MSSSIEIQAADMRPPSGSAVPTAAVRLAGTGGTGEENVTALTDGEMATLLVGANSIRVRFGGDATVEASTTDPLLPAYGRFDWRVNATRDDFVSVQAGDGASAFEAWVWTSSGPRAGE